jgi:hypothetical protein
MDTTVLVEEYITDGRAFLRELHRDGVRVDCACWAKPEKGDFWKLWLVLPDLCHQNHIEISKKSQEAYKRLKYPRMRWDAPTCEEPTSPKAIDLLALQSRCNPNKPIRFGELRIGGEYIDGAYLYPRLPLKMTPLEVLQEVVQRIIQSHPDVRKPSIVTLNDGSSFDGVPIALSVGDQRGSVIRIRKDDGQGWGEEISLSPEQIVGIE